MATLLDEFKTITQALNEAGIEYAVCGGWAMAIHGFTRATIDIDLLIAADDLDRVWTLAKQVGYDVEGLPLRFADGAIEIRRISKIDKESKQLYTLDFLIATPPLAEVWAERQQIEWAEGTTWVVSKRGLIELKRITRSGFDRHQESGGRHLMVDMSPEAVTRRLRLMDELWELSVALMHARQVPDREVVKTVLGSEDDGNTSLNREPLRRRPDCGTRAWNSCRI